jgi:phthiocerol/phenolphthiocerol synthesis type-I polyketide synthase E
VVAQPALFALQYSLAELWKSWGVCPTAVAEHCIGEYAACASPAFFRSRSASG